MKARRFFPISLTLVLCLSASSYLTQAQELVGKDKRTTITAAAANPVVGSGTVGRLSKWAGVSGTSTYTLGDSNIFEDKFGRVGIGTTTPTSPLTVQGMIEITLGGLKFPDGTVQTTSAAGSLSTVAHDATLKGDGTLASPLGVASPLEVRDVTKTSVLADQFITSTSVDGANNPVLGPIDTSGARSIRILVLTDSCSPCSDVNISVRSDAFMPIDDFTVGPAFAGAVTRVYEVPGTQLRMFVGNAAPSSSNSVHIIVLGRSN